MCVLLQLAGRIRTPPPFSSPFAISIFLIPNDTMNNDRNDYCENENELYTKNNVGVHTTILSHNDNVIIPSFRNNLIRICINECVKVFAIVDTGAVTTAMSL